MPSGNGKFLFIAVVVAVAAFMLVTALASGLFTPGGSGNQTAGLRGQTPTGGEAESLPVEGVAYLSVYNPQGQLVAQWKGHNSLFPISEEAIAKCLSGVTPNPPGYVGCDRYTDLMWIYWSSGGTTYYDIEQTTPPGQWVPPVPGCSDMFCGTWEVSATFSGFTSTNCGTSCTVSGANAGEACQSTFGYDSFGHVSSSSTICTGPKSSFPDGNSCATNYSYDSSGDMIESSLASACSTTASGFPGSGPGVINSAWSTYPSLCDSNGACGTSITTNSNGQTIADQFVGFDTLSPSIAVGPGDTLVATILYTVG